MLKYNQDSPCNPINQLWISLLGYSLEKSSKPACLLIGVCCGARRKPLQKECHSFPFSEMDHQDFQFKPLETLKHSGLQSLFTEGKGSTRGGSDWFNSTISFLVLPLFQWGWCFPPTCNLLPGDIQTQDLWWHYSLAASEIVSFITLPDWSQFQPAQLGSKHGDFLQVIAINGCESLTKFCISQMSQNRS